MQIYNILNDRKIYLKKPPLTTEKQYYKVWWCSNGGKSGAYYQGDIKPTHTGMTINYSLGDIGAPHLKGGVDWNPYTNPGGDAVAKIGLDSGEVIITAQGGTSSHDEAQATVTITNQASLTGKETNRITKDGLPGGNNAIYNSWTPPIVDGGASNFEGYGKGGRNGSGGSGQWQTIPAKIGLIRIITI